MSSEDDDDNPIVLSFHNSLIRQSDLRLLNRPHWLNDTIIGFYFEYLEYTMCKDLVDKVAFVCPEIVQFLKHADSSEVGPFVESMNLAKKAHVFMAVNDSEAQESPGGTHWSLLLFDKATSTFHHHDSYNNFNEPSARIIADNLAPHLRQPDGGEPCKFVEEERCTQQTNSYDCGVHVILNANKLVCQLLFNHDYDDGHVHNEGHDKIIEWCQIKSPTAVRKALQDLILELGHRS